jgi:hypothetical protein
VLNTLPKLGLTFGPHLLRNHTLHDTNRFLFVVYTDHSPDYYQIKPPNDFKSLDLSRLKGLFRNSNLFSLAFGLLVDPRDPTFSFGMFSVNIRVGKVDLRFDLSFFC